MSQPLVINVILNTSRREDTLACLESLARSTYANQRTIVLDNASTDGSVAAIRAHFPEVQIIALSENLGYAGNNNAGIRAAVAQGADWVFVLNEDIICAPDCLEELIFAAQHHPRAGVLGPLVYHHNEPGVIQSAGGALDGRWRSIHLGQNEPDHGQFAEARRVDWISGCAILVRSEAIRQAGMLDEAFFYYWEETEWCLRIREHGWETWNVPQAKIWHKGVQRDYRPNPNVTYYATRNHLMLLARHHAPAGVWAYTLLRSAGTLASWTLRPKWRGMRQHRQAMWQGLVDFFNRRHGMRPTP